MIIDSCRHHGVWFDADELSRLLAFIRSGRHAESVRREEQQRRRYQRHREITRPRRSPVTSRGLGDPADEGNWGMLLAAGMLELVDDLPAWWR